MSAVQPQRLPSDAAKPATMWVLNSATQVRRLVENVVQAYKVLATVPLDRACVFAWVRRVADTFDSSELGEDLRESKASERLRNGSDGRDESEEHTARQQGDLKNVD